MRPVYVTVVGSTGGPNSDGNSAVIPTNVKQTPFNIGIGTILVSGSATWSVQHTFDDITVGAPTTWFTNSGINAVSANTDGNYAYPVTAIRLHVSVGSGTVKMAVIQGLGSG